MAQEIKLNAEIREACGTTAARRFRRAGAVPAVLSRVGGGSQLLSLNAHDFERMLSKHVSEQLVLVLNVGGSETLALMRQIQRHGVTGKVIHADFGEITRDHKLHVRIPIVLHGEPEGVRNQGGVLEQVVRELDVNCLPGDVVEQFDVDVTHLALGDTILVANLNLGAQFTLLTHADVAVATVVAPQAEEAAEAVTAEGGEAPTPEVVSKKKAEG